MNIVNFTPLSALLGGLLIGLSVALFFILNGRMIGISGIASNFIVSKENRIENFLFLIGLIAGPLIYNLISGNINDFRKATPFLDTFTTGVFFSAMWLMANKKLESWTLWIIGNIVSIPLYFVKGYGFTGVQYLVFLILAIMGYIEWRKQITNKSSEN